MEKAVLLPENPKDIGKMRQKAVTGMSRATGAERNGEMHGQNIGFDKLIRRIV